MGCAALTPDKTQTYYAFVCVPAHLAGDTKITLRWIQNTPHVVIINAFAYYQGGTYSANAVVSLVFSAVMMLKARNWHTPVHIICLTPPAQSSQQASPSGAQHAALRKSNIRSSP